MPIASLVDRVASAWRQVLGHEAGKDRPDIPDRLAPWAQALPRWGDMEPAARWLESVLNTRMVGPAVTASTRQGPNPLLTGYADLIQNVRRTTGRATPFDLGGLGRLGTGPTALSWFAATQASRAPRLSNWQLILSQAAPSLATAVGQAKAGQTFGLGAMPELSGAAGQYAGVFRWRDLVNQVAGEHGVPWQVIAAIMQIESGGNPDAISSAGARGLMQVMPFHFGPGENPMDPLTNLRTATRLLRDLYTRWGSWEKAAAGYFGALDRYGNITGASDGNTTGHGYVNLFRQHLNALNALSPAAQGLSNIGSWTGEAAGALKRAIDVGMSFVGRPYVWGGASPATGFDCSGLVQWSFSQAGVRLPRTAQAQWNATQRVGDPRPGDLVFFHSTYATSDYITHVGIYLGGGMMLHSGSRGIEVVSLSQPYYQQHFAGFGRVY